MRRRTASGVSVTETVSVADAGALLRSSEATPGSLMLICGDIRRTDSRNAAAARDISQLVFRGSGLLAGRSERRSGARSWEPLARAYRGTNRTLHLPWCGR